MSTPTGGQHASPPSPATVREALSPKPKLATLEPAAKGKKSGPLSPTLSDSDEDHQWHASNSPPRPLASISEAEDAGDDDSDDPEAETARNAGMQGMQTESEVKSGYLMKKGERRKAWKKRWFVLRAKRICYYKDEKEYKLLRDISMNDVSTVAEVQVKKHEHVFGIVTPQRTYYVEARSHADMQDWVAQIERHRDEYRRTKAEEVSLATMDTPDTPTRRPDGTSTPTQPITITGPSPPIGIVGSTPFSSSFATSSTSHFSPDGFSSSYTSQGSTSSAVQPSAPPNSFAQGGVGALGAPTDLKSVDTRLARQRQDSGNSSMYESGLGRAGSQRQRPVSPGVASSSEDEDDDYFGDAVSPTSNPASPLQLSSLDPNKVIMSGYLTKQGKRKTWRKRYFILVSARLMYARSHMDQKIHRQIPLARILDVVDVDAPVSPQRHRADGHAHEGMQSPVLGGGGEKRYDNSFRIITAKRTYIVCAPDEESAIKWISAIKVLLNAQRQPAITDSPVVKSPSPLPEPVGLPAPALQSAAHPSAAAAPVTRTSANATIEGLPSIETQMQQASLGGDPQRAVHPGHQRARSVTDAAKLAVREAGERYSARV